ncbi:DMT family transporter [Companilactobacillus musae]|uniref:DMT family transporter n=1 Tax=Companilactobacillus musae TaxID=1903258 RepID=UPI000E64A010|nr:DMT family transporter [Companilactobacillus musae]
MLLFILLGITTGGFIPLQTSINSQLRNRVKTPFLVGTIFLIILSVLTGSGIPLMNGSLSSMPWWGYLGGIIGMICLTINIFLFPILGSVQTVIIPMVGQILMSVIIDNFGWFYAKTSPLSLTKLLGIILVIAGIMITIALPSILSKKLLLLNLLIKIRN